MLSKGLLFAFLVLWSVSVKAQNSYTYSGKIINDVNDDSIPNAVINLAGSSIYTFSKKDGSFSIQTNKWYDSLKISLYGFQDNIIPIDKGNSSNIVIRLKSKSDTL